MTDIPKDPQPWVQPLFMVYHVGTDQMVPLTQERLDQLIATERQYGQMISEIRQSHDGFVSYLGGMPRPWADLKAATNV